MITKENSKLFGTDNTKEKISFSKILCIFSDAILAFSLILATITIFWYFKAFEMLAENPEITAVPDLAFLAYLLPAAFVFAGLTHTFYYNKERFANCIKIYFDFIKQLLIFKKSMGLYSKDELQEFVDSEIDKAQMGAEGIFNGDVTSSSAENQNISV